MKDDEQRYRKTLRLPQDAWLKMHELAMELSHTEKRTISTNEVLVRLLRKTKSAKHLQEGA